jgi:hypothetical protein
VWEGLSGGWLEREDARSVRRRRVPFSFDAGARCRGDGDGSATSGRGGGCGAGWVAVAARAAGSICFLLYCSGGGGTTGSGGAAQRSGACQRQAVGYFVLGWVVVGQAGRLGRVVLGLVVPCGS